MAASDHDHEGYDYSFLEHPDKEHCCPICLLVLRDPHQTECCGNHFCQCCIQKITSLCMECPLCKAPDFTTVLDKFFLRKIHALKLRCPQQSNGCLWIGELGDVDRHLDPASGQCSAVFPCRYGCGERLLVYRLTAHHDLCECRPHRCEYCNDYNGTHADVVRNHVPVCPKYPLDCPNGCGAKGIQRSNVGRHLKKCPLSQVECKFKRAGCNAKMNAKDMSAHYSKNLSRHLKITYSAFIRLSEQYQRERDSVAAEVQSLRQKLAHAEAELSIKGSALASIERKMSATESAIKDRGTQIQSLQAELEGVRSEAHDHAKTKDVLQQKLIAQTEQLSNQQVDVQSLQIVVKAKDSEIKGYVAQIQSLQANLKTVRSQIQNHVKREDILQQNLSKHAALMQKNLDAKDMEILSHRTQIKYLQQEKDQTVAKVQSLRADLKASHSQVQDLELQLHHSTQAALMREKDVQIKSLQQDQSFMTQIVQSQKQHIDEIRLKHSQLDILLQSSTHTVEELKAKIDTLQSNLETKEALLSTKESLLQGRIAEVTALEQGVALREQQLQKQAAIIQQLKAKYDIKEQDCAFM